MFYEEGYVSDYVLIRSSDSTVSTDYLATSH